MHARSAVLVALGALLAAPAWAQSKRYPPQPVDRDQEKADHSVLWDNATNPSSETYRDLIAKAKQAMADRTDPQLLAAEQLLDQAITLVPAKDEAYAVRGDAHFQLRMWERCAADLGTALARAPRSDDSADKKLQLEQRRKLGLCLARAGKLADAESVLAEATAAGNGTGEMLMRLGEIRIAMGKLEEAIGALSAALEATDTPSQSLARWLLASAYDRARRPSEAIDEARRAAIYDRSFGSIRGQSVPLLGAGEAEYLLAFAWSAVETPRPELATVYFRQYLKIAPDAPWRKRAEEHLRELKDAQLPDTVDKEAGVGTLDEAAAAAIVRKAIGPMRACLAKTPTSALKVTLIKAGPRSKPDPKLLVRDPYRARYMPRPPTPPPEGVTVAPSMDVPLDATRADIDAAARCIEPLASKLVLPPIKEKDTWYKLSFLVVSP